MFHLDTGIIVMFCIAFFAATVNGALGYGFSSLTVPVALLFFSNKVLSPALVLIELGVNAWVVILNRGSLAAVRRRAIPILFGLIPGVLLGSYLLTNVNSGWLKLWTYIVLLPLIFLQAAGFRRPIKAEHIAGVPLGIGVGTLVMIVNPILLGCYTLGCHSLRHLVGGRLDEVSKAPARKTAYDCVSCLNRRHMMWAWFSLFWVGFTDLYIRLCSMGILTDWRIL